MKNVINSELLSGFTGVRFAMSTRQGGVSPHPFGMNLSFKVGDDPVNVRQNRVRFFGGLDIQAERQAFPHQCHSATVLAIHEAGEYESCDGLVTATSNLWLSISIADCVPVMLFDPKKRIIAALHAGWRGTSGHIIPAAIQLMRKDFQTSPSDLVAYIGPSAGVCCYEVGEEVLLKFSPDVQTRVNGSVHLDLKKENQRQLLAEGVVREHIEVSSSCTICSPQLFHSYRREKKRSGRMMAVIGLRS